jgi:hypothetical protein
MVIIISSGHDLPVVSFPFVLNDLIPKCRRQLFNESLNVFHFSARLFAAFPSNISEAISYHTDFIRHRLFFPVKDT